MKKVLVLMGAFLAFAACDPVSDCDCTVSGEMLSIELFTDEAATVTEFEGTCDEVTFADLTSEWVDGESLGLTLSCVER